MDKKQKSEKIDLEDDELEHLSEEDVAKDVIPLESVEETDDEATAESELKEDEAELEGLIILAKASKNPTDILAVAVKAKQLADLYYAALETFSNSFYYYKDLAAEYYLKLAKDSSLQNAELMAILMYFQANNFEKARKVFNNIIKKTEKKKLKNQPDNVIIQICQDILENKTKSAEINIKKGLYDVDTDVQNEISRTFKYLAENQRKE